METTTEIIYLFASVAMTAPLLVISWALLRTIYRNGKEKTQRKKKAAWWDTERKRRDREGSFDSSGYHPLDNWTKPQLHYK